jgi:flagellar basal-body rod protein FlgC
LIEEVHHGNVRQYGCIGIRFGRPTATTQCHCEQSCERPINENTDWRSVQAAGCRLSLNGGSKRISWDFSTSRRWAVAHALEGVSVARVVEDSKPGQLIYDPHHPDANPKGFVRLPNVNVMEEMVNMIGASRAYEANVQAINATRAMWNKALEIGR